MTMLNLTKLSIEALDRLKSLPGVTPALKDDAEQQRAFREFGWNSPLDKPEAIQGGWVHDLTSVELSVLTDTDLFGAKISL